MSAVNIQCPSCGKNTKNLVCDNCRRFISPETANRLHELETAIERLERELKAAQERVEELENCQPSKAFPPGSYANRMAQIADEHAKYNIALIDELTRLRSQVEGAVTVLKDNELYECNGCGLLFSNSEFVVGGTNTESGDDRSWNCPKCGSEDCYETATDEVIKQAIARLAPVPAEGGSDGY